MKLLECTKKELYNRVKGFKSAGKMMRINKSITFTEIFILPQEVTSIEDAKEIFSQALGREIKTYAITANQESAQELHFKDAFVCKPGFHWLAIVHGNQLLALNGHVFQKVEKTHNTFEIHKIVGKQHRTDYIISQSH